MEDYLEELSEIDKKRLENRGVAEVLREKFLPDPSSKDDREVFEFLMSYRWG